jgi:hypothetical protein
MNIKIKYVLYGIVTILLITTFFFKTIPVPVENMEGSIDKNNFIYGGLFWTSALYQLQVKEFEVIFAYSLLFLTLYGGIFLIEI